MKGKICKKCKIFVEKQMCPICKGTQLSDNWKGRIIILNAEKSEIAKKMNINQNGTYAIKTK